MNDQLLAVAIAAVFNADSDLLIQIPNIHAANSGDITTRPSLTIHGEYDNYGTSRKGVLTFELLSRMADEQPDPAPVTPGPNHQTRFEALWEKLFGAVGSSPSVTASNRAAAKAALLTAVNAVGGVTLAAYGPAKNTVEANVDGDDLRTHIQIAVAFRFTV